MSGDEKTGSGVEELRAQIQELQQKLVMAKQAVNDKEEELRNLRKAMEDAKDDAKMDLQRERKAWNESNRANKEEIAELQEQIEHLNGYVGECKEALAQQEGKGRDARTTAEPGDVEGEIRS